MTGLPPIFYSLKFYEAIAFLVAGVLGLLVLYGKIPPENALTPAAILAWIIAFLRMFGIVPELRARGLLK